MKKCIIYVSCHHKNTKALVDAIAASDEELEVFNGLKELDSLDEYDVIGFASGVAHGKMYSQILNVMETTLPENKKIFFICTSGTKKKKYFEESLYMAKKKNATVLGSYMCKGYDTYGILGKLGGISKKHPNDKDKQKAVDFYKQIISKE